MITPIPPPASPDEVVVDYRFLLANERTFLAWMRTSLALIAGGLALDQFVRVKLGLRPRPARRRMNSPGPNRARQTSYPGLLCLRRATRLALRVNRGARSCIARREGNPLRVGQRQFGVDRWRFTASGQYSWPLGEGREVFMAADYAGFGPTQFAANVRQDYKSLVGAQAGVRLGSFRGEVYAKNLLDEDFVQIYSESALLVGPRGRSVPGDPRSYGIRLRYEF